MRWRVERLFWLAFVPGLVAAACGSRTDGEYLQGDFEGPAGPAVGTATGAGGVVSSADGATSTIVGAGGFVDGVSTTTSTRPGSSAIGSITVGGPISTASDTSSGTSSSMGGRPMSSTSDSSSGMSNAGGFAGTMVGVGGISSTGAGGSVGVGPCCMASYGLGCDDDEVGDCVCDFDSYCCDTAWDEICVQEVEYLNCGFCDAPFGGFGAVTTNAASVASVTVGTVATSAGGMGGSASVTSGGMGGTGGAFGSCCEISDDYGCDDPEVEACVCSYDYYCCYYSWDSICVDEVEYLGCGFCSAPFGGTGGVTSTTTVSTVGVGGASTDGGSTTLGEGGSGGVGQCVEQSETQCEACLCTDCFEQYGDCIADFGCPEIVSCLDESGCSGSDCLVACADVIDEFGGLEGASVGYTVALISCATDAGCPCD